MAPSISTDSGGSIFSKITCDVTLPSQEKLTYTFEVDLRNNTLESTVKDLSEYIKSDPEVLESDKSSLEAGIICRSFHVESDSGDDLMDRLGEVVGKTLPVSIKRADHRADFKVTFFPPGAAPAA